MARKLGEQGSEDVKEIRNVQRWQGQRAEGSSRVENP